MRVLKDKNLTDFYIRKNNLHKIFDDEILTLAQLLYFEKNEFVLKEGNKLKNYYYFIEGEIQASYSFENGKTMPLKVYKDFQPIGDIELIKDLNILTNIEAIESSYFIVFPIEIIREAYNSNINFLKHFSEFLSEKIYSVIKNSSHNYVYPLENRLASFLIQQENKSYVNIKTFKLVAQSLGTSYRHLYRTLKKFEKDAIILCEKKTIKILDKNALKEKVRALYIKSF